MKKTDGVALAKKNQRHVLGGANTQTAVKTVMLEGMQQMGNVEQLQLLGSEQHLSADHPIQLQSQGFG